MEAEERREKVCDCEVVSYSMIILQERKEAREREEMERQEALEKELRAKRQAEWVSGVCAWSCCNSFWYRMSG